MKRFISTIIAAAGITLAALAADTPQYPGGEEAMNAFIAENLQYPAAAKANGIEGVVQVSFLVKADGSIGSIKIVRMIDPDLEQEAIRLVKTMPKWTPADKNGTPVDANATVTIPFSLEG